MTRFLYLFVFIISAFVAQAQEMNAAAQPAMADTFRSEGKIYVVIAVLAITFICLIGYLIYIDLKVRKLEKRNK